MGAAVVAVLLLLAVGVLMSALSTAQRSTAGELDPPGPGRAAAATPTTSPGPSAGAGGGVFVHILGRVAKPGLYEVAAGSRAVDVVTAAGGFAGEADQSALNLARRVTDGEQIVVPAVGEAPAPPNAGGPSQSVEGAKGAGSGAGSVDLNSADSAALETIPGVGPATAQAILAWRTDHGRFEAVEDLLDVTGIGEKKLASMRDVVTVG